MARMMVNFENPILSEALIIKARREHRDPREQVILYVEYGLQRDGLLPSDAPQPAPSPAQPQHPQAVRS